jgi:Domain of unknown function (DUF4398)
MKYLIPIIPLTLAACGPAYAPPVQRMADAQAAYRSAQEAGADNDPQAQLHLKLAEEQFAKAKTAMAEEENRRAEFLLIRAKADAELALAMAQERAIRADAQKAQVDAQKTSEAPTPNTSGGTAQ